MPEISGEISRWQWMAFLARQLDDKNFTFAIPARETPEMPRKYRMSFDAKFRTEKRSLLSTIIILYFIALYSIILFMTLIIQ